MKSMAIVTLCVALSVSVALAQEAKPEAAAGASADEQGFVPLFDGKSIEGWIQRGGSAKYEVVDGMIVGTSVPDTPNSFLSPAKEYGDFILELDFKVDEGLNSGVQIRSAVKEDKDKRSKGGRVHGYQVEIDPSPRAYTGGIYGEATGRGWIQDLSQNEAARKAFKPGEWNHFRIECQGDSIKTFLNGVLAADLKDDMSKSGLIALQVHSVGKNGKPGTQVRWKNIKIKDLSAEK
ncbi:MAG: 3-keto-disaccharide hydrolase [Planctomycetota bacterium]